MDRIIDIKMEQLDQYAEDVKYFDLLQLFSCDGICTSIIWSGLCHQFHRYPIPCAHLIFVHESLLFLPLYREHHHHVSKQTFDISSDIE